MGFLKKVLDRFITEDFPHEAVEPSQVPAEPMMPQILLKNPLSLAVEGIVKAIHLPETEAELMQELTALTADGTLSPSRLQAFDATIAQRIAILGQQLHIAQKKQEEAKSLGLAIDLLEELAKETELLITASAEDAAPDCEDYPAAPCVLSFLRLHRLLQRLLEELHELGLPAPLVPTLRSLATSTDAIAAEEALLRSRIEGRAQESKALREEIARFSGAVHKIKSMGQAGMNQYYQQLATAQASLEERRTRFLSEEESFSHLIQALYRSLQQALEAFVPYATPLEQALRAKAATLRQAQTVISEQSAAQSPAQLLQTQSTLSQLSKRLLELSALQHRPLP